MTAAALTTRQRHTKAAADIAAHLLLRIEYGQDVRTLPLPLPGDRALLLVRETRASYQVRQGVKAAERGPQPVVSTQAESSRRMFEQLAYNIQAPAAHRVRVLPALSPRLALLMVRRER